MEVKIKKWGNSLGIRIPKNLLKSLNFEVNDILELNEENKKIIVSKSNKKKISLEKRFKEYKGDNCVKDFEWDEARGDEIW